MDEDDVVRIANSRVRLDTVVYGVNEGASAEEISARYPSLKLDDIRPVIDYYSRHRLAVDTYLRDHKAVTAEVRRQNEARFPSAGLRERLLPPSIGWLTEAVVKRPIIKNVLSVDAENLVGDLIQPSHPLFGLIWINSERVSGTPCFYGTRVPIKTLFDSLAARQSLAEFLDDFEGVGPEQAEALLELASSHFLDALPKCVSR